MDPRVRPFVRWPILALAGVVLLAVVVVADPGPLPGEVAYIAWLQRRGGPVPRLAELVRATTSTEATLIVAAPIAMWLLWRRRVAALPAIAIAAATMLIAQPAFKEIVDRPRPTEEQVEVRAEHTSMSFPSGHSMSTTTVWGAAAATAWRSRKRTLATLAAVPIALTGVSSGVQGVHWPSDAIAGTALGALAAWAIALAHDRPARHARAPD